jgi:4-amino-4-deoxy-L-arabinose transferase-like glycosyltransferase
MIRETRAGTSARRTNHDRWGAFWRHASQIDTGLLLILLLGTVLRLQYLDMPFAEAHRWRTVTNADVTRNFFLRSMNIFWPQVSWGGPAGYVGMEFPLLQWIAALLYRLFGEHEVLCRLTSIAFSVGTIPLLFALGRRLFGTVPARAAAFLVAVSPSMVFFGRSFISDVPMIFFAVAAILGYVAYLETDDRSWAAAGAASTALAGLVKLPAIAIAAPIAWAAWRARGWKAWRDWWITGGIGLALVVVAAWYWHADRIYHLTGLTEAIFHSSDNPPPELAPFAGQPLPVVHWGAYGLLLTSEYYARIRDWTWHLHLTPVGFSLALVGLVMMFQVPGYGLVLVWLAAVIATMLASVPGSFYHEFHQLPLVPPAALLFGLVAAPLFDGQRLRARFGGWWGPPIAAALLTALALMAFLYSGIVHNYYRPDALDMGPVRVGHALRDLVPRDDFLITVEFSEYGNNSPIVLYHAQRRGWSFDVRTISPEVMEVLRKRHGAKYFVTTVWPQLARQQPELARYLEGKRRIDLGRAMPGAVLFELF